MNILHSLNSNKNHYEIAALTHSLSEYGLSPADWKIAKESCDLYKISNKSEPDFYFKGKTKYEKGRKKWANIQLVSL